MVFGDPYTKWYTKAITELERTKNELRTSLEMTTDTRDKVLGLLYQNEKKYNKDLLTVFKNWEVVSDMRPDGVEPNDDWYYLLNLHLNAINSSV